jgi:amidase
MQADPVHAFCPHGAADLQTHADGPLAGLTFGVKDLFDVAGLPTGAGSPAWLATHPVPTRTAPAVERLLNAGARLVGKTQTDEIAWSLTGQNAHYGTPINAAAPDRIPGGSSSGSAAATAAGLVDFALGSDTGGSVRLPASFCGLYGMRPTHGRIPIDGAVPLAPSYDSVGWFARDADILARVGAVLLDDPGPMVAVTQLLIAEDLFALAGAEVHAALAGGIVRVERELGPARRVAVLDGGADTWRDVFRTIQASEAWRAHGAWVTEVQPAFGPGVRERFAAAAELAVAEVDLAKTARLLLAGAVRAFLRPGTLLLLPGAPGIAPLRTASHAELEAFRQRAMGLLCPAGHAGVPQIALPFGTLDGCPIGLGVMAWADGDSALLQLARSLGPGDA